MQINGNEIRTDQQNAFKVRFLLIHILYNHVSMPITREYLETEQGYRSIHHIY